MKKFEKYIYVVLIIFLAVAIIAGLDPFLFKNKNTMFHDLKTLRFPGDNHYDASSWDNTKATLSVLKYDANKILIVNMNKREVVIAPNLMMYEDNGERYLVEPGQEVKGFIHVEKDAFFGYNVTVTESKPDEAKLQLAVEMALKEYPEVSGSPILGPMVACSYLSYDGETTYDKKVAQDLCQMYYQSELVEN